ncbi:divalent-cation tolerance protein CutA [Thalassomonas sp. M1454]|uniref:divalent-cation tolerance protein CutA n=1 Tax=Thalassomonas sp. M1454 TaxID=2594477 RepID=UPI00117D7729|nr:divalent-cation tolerance protein CutA [Thalassomonas sp. M1454]TRX53145.1 divalent-cation tolerance protein CutA [Thalassomonas sp. M1454]
MHQVVITNCPNDEVAQNIAKKLVTKRLAACVNIMPNITSVYEWQGELQQDSEVMLIIKTKSSLFTELKQHIEQLHPYDVAEIIALDIQQGNELYLNWITNTVKD